MDTGGRRWVMAPCSCLSGGRGQGDKERSQTPVAGPSLEFEPRETVGYGQKKHGPGH